MDAKYLLIVKVPRGLIVRDRPAPESEGSRQVRSEAVGKHLKAYAILNIEGVKYAALVPQNPLRPEYVRVAERDGSIEYVEVIPFEDNSGNADVARALNRIADVLEVIGRADK